MMTGRLIYKSLFFFTIVGTLTSCRVARNISKENAFIDSVYVPKITLQDRKNFIFNNGDLTFSNQFLAGRLNRIEQVNDSTFTIFIEPENRPINPSPWYAFKIWSKNSRNLYLSLHYYANKHRYDPKTSTDGIVWDELKGTTLNKDSTVSFFKLPVNTDTLTVAAQEVINSVSAYEWIDGLAELPFMKKQVIGHSRMGKPILALSNTESSGKNIVVVISRQHPPEVTGYLAMQEFVHELTAASDLAKKFREKFEVVIVPMINPDGVDEGNWRHSFDGVDLNRDWEFFKQPETRAVKDFLLTKISDQQAKVYLAFDFHSTWHDILYTNSDTLTNFPGLTRQWIAGFQKELGVTLKVSPSGNGGNVSKSWFSRELKADALTYEVGDDTSRDLIKKKGKLAALVMMEILIQKMP
jgi:cytosolic carboxypeptidase protein 6